MDINEEPFGISEAENCQHKDALSTPENEGKATMHLILFVNIMQAQEFHPFKNFVKGKSDDILEPKLPVKVYGNIVIRNINHVPKVNDLEYQEDIRVLSTVGNECFHPTGEYDIQVNKDPYDKLYETSWKQNEFISTQISNTDEKD